MRRPRAARVLLVWIAISGISYLLYSEEVRRPLQIGILPRSYTISSEALGPFVWMPELQISTTSSHLVGQRYEKSSSGWLNCAKFSATVATTYKCRD